MAGGHWEFDESKPSSVRVDVTQRDQFNNDDVGLCEALVRESIQNSTDANSGGGPTRIRFAVNSLTPAQAEFLAKRMQGLVPHLKECAVTYDSIFQSSVKVLAIEDFNTKGLSGRVDDIDKGNFDRFWRSVGDSGKGGKQGGRWGLGKLVYSSASELKSFFGITVTKERPRPALMGQAVLRNHRIDDKFFPAHGFYFGARSPRLGLQLPVDDADEIEFFKELGKFRRTDQTGLSLLIPYLGSGVSEDAIIAAVVEHYYFPILSGDLSVEVGGKSITRENFVEVAATAKLETAPPLEFVKGVSDALRNPKPIVAANVIDATGVKASSFADDDLKSLKSRFSSGGLVHARIGVKLKPRESGDVTGYVDLFLSALPDDKKSFSLVARGPITLPGERRYFGSSAAFGAMVANEEKVASFLGDAENPAHTAWNPKAEKLGPGWRSPAETLRTIRHSLRELYMLVAEQKETEEKEALIDFFSIAQHDKANPKKKPIVPNPPTPPEPRPKAIVISGTRGGFEIKAGPATENWTYPKTIVVRAAYDMLGANPFKRHSPFDFDLSKKGDISITSENAAIEAKGANTIIVTAQAPNFQISASGFDVRRDIVVDARTK